MITCEKCLHNGVCYLQETCCDINAQIAEFGCEDFSDASEWLHLPCKVGDSIYRIVLEASFYEGVKYAVSEQKMESVQEIEKLMWSGDIGETVFFVKEEAENKKQELILHKKKKN